MATFAFVAPLLPGKAETDRESMQRFSTGEEKEAYEASRRALGFKREAVWHQETPDGTIAIVVWEADDIGAAFGGIAPPSNHRPRAERSSSLVAHPSPLCRQSWL